MNACSRKNGTVSPNVASPIWLSAVRWTSPWKPISAAGSSAMCTSAASASAVIPANMVVASSPMTTSVVAALRLLGSSNAGTPLDTASTPVSAVHPDANARSTRNTPAAPPVSATPRSW